MTDFFEGALLPSTEAGRARAFSCTIHILSRTGKENTTEGGITQITAHFRDKVRNPLPQAKVATRPLQ